MSGYNFIFSNKPSIRFLRHLSFWIVFGTHFFIQSLLVPGVNEALTPRTPLESLINICYFLPIYIISVYTFIEIVIPNSLFKSRYTLFFISASVLLLFNFFGCYFSGLIYEHRELNMPYSQITFAVNKYHGIVNGLFVSVIIMSIAGGIKSAKKWFQKQRENEALAQQKINSELQLLKIQINPRFLFHSLHSVKQHILADSPRSPKLILQVADLLSYILYESEKDYATLEKELGIVNDYISLEENIDGENSQMSVSITGNVHDKYITPLILLSIVEAGFEYFLENREQEFTIKLFIDVVDDQLDFRLVYKTLNKYSSELFELNEKFTSIRKQLKNLYSDSYHFRVEFNSGNITILLKNLPLHNYKRMHEELQRASDTYENV